MKAFCGKLCYKKKVVLSGRGGYVMSVNIRKVAISDAVALKDLYFNHLTSYPPTEEQNMTTWREMLRRFANDDNAFGDDRNDIEMLHICGIDEWTGPLIVSKGHVWDTSALPGFVAVNDKKTFAALLHIGFQSANVKSHR